MRSKARMRDAYVMAVTAVLLRYGSDNFAKTVNQSDRADDDILITATETPMQEFVAAMFAACSEAINRTGLPSWRNVL
jgi:hypothetical protein